MKQNINEDERVVNIDLSMGSLRSYLNDEYFIGRAPEGIKDIMSTISFYTQMREDLGYSGRLNFAYDISNSLKKLNLNSKKKVEPYVKDLMRALYSQELLDEVSNVREELSNSYIPNVRGLVAVLGEIEDGEIHVFDLDYDLDTSISKAKIDLMQTQGMVGVEGLIRFREKISPYL